MPEHLSVHFAIRKAGADPEGPPLGWLVLDRENQLSASADDAMTRNALAKIATEINDRPSLQLPSSKSNASQPFMTYQSIIRRGDPRFTEAVAHYLKKNCGVAVVVEASP